MNLQCLLLCTFTRSTRRTACHGKGTWGRFCRTCMDVCSTVVHSTGCRGISALAHGATSSSSSFFDLGGHRAIPHTFLLTLWPVQHFWPFLNTLSQRHRYFSPTGSAVPCWGTIWKWLCPPQGRLWPPLTSCPSSLPASTSPLNYSPLAPQSPFKCYTPKHTL